jgi:hypothetical protein
MLYAPGELCFLNEIEDVDDIDMLQRRRDAEFLSRAVSVYHGFSRLALVFLGGVAFRFPVVEACVAR